MTVQMRKLIAENHKLKGEISGQGMPRARAVTTSSTAADEKLRQVTRENSELKGRQNALMGELRETCQAKDAWIADLQAKLHEATMAQNQAQINVGELTNRNAQLDGDLK